MWATILTLEDGALESSVPAWLVDAATSHAMIGYGREIAAELLRNPGLYGYVPANRYDVIAQTWDAAFDNVPSLAWGRKRVGQGAVGLIPDFYYVQSRGYDHLRYDASISPRWEDRHPIVAWRGSVTGGQHHRHVAALPRVQLATICRTIPSTDVRLFTVHETMGAYYSIADIEAHVAEHDLGGERWHMYSFGHYRYSIDIDGHANAWGFLEKLILGCCVLKVESAYEQWYYGRIQPWVHYVPVAEDLSDLAEKIDWALSHDDEARWIANNGAAFAASLDYQSQLQLSCHAFLAAANVARGTGGCRR